MTPDTDRQWEANTRKDPPKVKVNSRRQPDDDADPSSDSFGVSQYTKARAVREHYLARLAKLEFEEKVGSLVSKDEVKIAQFNIDRQRRDAMLNIADRVCAAIAAEIKDQLVAAGVPVDRANAMDTSRVHDILTSSQISDATAAATARAVVLRDASAGANFGYVAAK